MQERARSRTTGSEPATAGEGPAPWRTSRTQQVQRRAADSAPATVASRPSFERGETDAQQHDPFGMHLLGGDETYYAEVTRIIEDFVQQFQAIPVTVPVGPPPASGADTRAKVAITVSIPYWNNDYSRYKQTDATTQGASYAYPQPSAEYTQANGAEAENSARQQEIAQYDAVLSTRDTLFTALAVAKGNPAEIGTMLQNAVEHGVIDGPAIAGTDAGAWGPAWKTAIEAWMKTTGIGLDCNGLVYQALLLVQQSTGARTSDANSIFEWFTVLDANGAIRRDVRTNASVELLGQLGDNVPVLELQPGDVMMIPGHIRIVSAVGARDAAGERIEFTTAESTVDGRSGPGVADNGPRAHQWQWLAGALSHQYEGETDNWQPSTETPAYRRHLRPPSP